MSGVSIERVSGPDVSRYIDDFARLRIAVFRDFPYLYEGTLASERSHLESYARSLHSVVIVARDGTRVVGASTAMPLAEHGELAPLFVAHGIDPVSVYYFGESVLDRAYRGHGIGHVFFDHREAAARAQGRTHASFCSVVRPKDHPARPVGYVPHDAFWSRRGYTKREDLTTSFRWRDLGEAEDTDKTMVFWIKELSS